MARIQIDLPSSFMFITHIPVRITDLNYGGHVGNDSILSLIHEGRAQFLKEYNLSEINFAGVGLIMSDVAITFKNELFYGDVVRMSVTAADLSKVSFDILYKLEKEAQGKMMQVAHAKTSMICFDYEKKKVMSIPEVIKERWQQPAN